MSENWADRATKLRVLRLYRRRLRTTMYAIIGVLLVATPIIFAFAPAGSVPFYIAAWLAIIAMIMGARSLNLAHRITVEQVGIPTLAPLPRQNRKDIIEQVEKYCKDVSLEQAKWWAEALIRPRGTFSRISERGEPQPGYMTRHITYTARFPADHDISSGLLPLELYRRGSLIDGLKLSDHAGKRVSSVPHDESVARVGAHLRVLASNVSHDYYDTYLRDVEPGLLTYLDAERPPSRIDIANFVSVTGRTTREAPVDRRGLAIMVALVCRGLLTRNPVWMLVSNQHADGSPSGASEKDDDKLNRKAGTRFTVEDQVIITDNRPKLSEGFLGLIHRHLRPVALVLLGLQDNSIRYHLSNASRATSYHFQTAGLPNTYLESHDIREWPNAWYQLRPSEGQAFSHFYTRRVLKSTSRSSYVARYYHVPPGPIGISALSSFVTLIAISVLAAQHMGWTEAETPASLGLLLGLPAAAIAFLGFDRSAGFLIASVTARVCSAVSFVIVVAAIIITAFLPGAAPSGLSQVTHDLADLGLNPRLWFFLVVIQIAALIYSTAIWFQRSHLYFALSKEKLSPTRRARDF